LCSALLARGATKVYAGARDVSSVRMDGVEAIQLDVTSPGDIAAAAAHCGDVTLLVNNAGIGTGTSALSADAIEMSKQESDTNVLGPLAVTQASHPSSGAGGGATSTSCPCYRGPAPQSALYCAAKAAPGSLTNASARAAPQGTCGGGTCRLHGHRLTAGLDVPKSSPDDAPAVERAGGG
jgi:NAD(P)-dependent dehydrogenase (short-subunit alcohol dehydrogenase family)